LDLKTVERTTLTMKEAAEYLGISYWLANQLGKSDMTVSRWCTNRSQPSVHQLIEIANLLDIDVSELLNKTK